MRISNSLVLKFYFHSAHAWASFLFIFQCTLLAGGQHSEAAPLPAGPSNLCSNLTAPAKSSTSPLTLDAFFEQLEKVAYERESQFKRRKAILQLKTPETLTALKAELNSEANRPRLQEFLELIFSQLRIFNSAEPPSVRRYKRAPGVGNEPLVADYVSVVLELLKAFYKKEIQSDLITQNLFENQTLLCMAKMERAGTLQQQALLFIGVYRASHLEPLRKTAQNQIEELSVQQPNSGISDTDLAANVRDTSILGGIVRHSTTGNGVIAALVTLFDHNSEASKRVIASLIADKTLVNLVASSNNAATQMQALRVLSWVADDDSNFSFQLSPEGGTPQNPRAMAKAQINSLIRSKTLLNIAKGKGKPLAQTQALMVLYSSGTATALDQLEELLYEKVLLNLFKNSSNGKTQLEILIIYKRLKQSTEKNSVSTQINQQLHWLYQNKLILKLAQSGANGLARAQAMTDLTETAADPTHPSQALAKSQLAEMVTQRTLFKDIQRPQSEAVAEQALRTLRRIANDITNSAHPSALDQLRELKKDIGL